MLVGTLMCLPNVATQALSYKLNTRTAQSSLAVTRSSRREFWEHEWVGEWVAVVVVVGRAWRHRAERVESVRARDVVTYRVELNKGHHAAVLAKVVRGVAATHIPDTRSPVGATGRNQGARPLVIHR